MARRRADAETVVLGPELLAAILGVSVNEVEAFVAQGMPVVTVEPLKLDAVAAVAWWRERLPGARARDELQLAKAQLDGESIALKLAEFKGDVVDVTTITRDGKSYALRWRAEFLNLPHWSCASGLVTGEQVSQLDDVVTAALFVIVGMRRIEDCARAVEMFRTGAWPEELEREGRRREEENRNAEVK